MILELNKAIVDRVKNTMDKSPFDKIPIVPEDLSKPIKRPSIKIDMEDVNVTAITQSYISYEVMVRIYFFAKDGNRPKIDNIAMQELIFEGFNEPLEVSGSFVEVYELNSDTIDGVLEVSFTIEYLKKRAEKPLEDMESMTMNLKESEKRK